MNTTNHIRLSALLAAATAIASLTGCSAQNAAGKHAVEQKAYTLYLASESQTYPEQFPLYFIDGVEDIPYVELNDWAALTSALFQGSDPDYALTVTPAAGKVTYERENAVTAVFDFDQQTITFDDYNKFLHNSEDTTLIDMVNATGFNSEGQPELFERDLVSSYDRYGPVKVIDLSVYNILMVKADSGYYVPLQTMNDLFFSPATNMSFYWNSENILLGNPKLMYNFNEGSFYPYGELFFAPLSAAGEKIARSEELSAYSYNELCLVLDCMYGLKDSHAITDFNSLFTEIGYDGAFQTLDPQEADFVLSQFITSYLDDLHSAFLMPSWMSGSSMETVTGNSARAFDATAKLYANARQQAYPEGIPAYQEVGNTAYITFDNFVTLYDTAQYYSSFNYEELPGDTYALIIYAHQQITREGSPIENVVLDMSNNTGGELQAGAFVISWMLGDASLSIRDTFTGAFSNSIYRADVNLDRAFDANDTISDKNLYCLISPVSFSMGNTVPSALSASGRVTMIGRTTGGGSCAVLNLSTADGTSFQISSPWQMSFVKNGSFYDIDRGVDPDFYINDISHYYDREKLTDYINGLY